MDRDIARGRLPLFETVALVLCAVMLEMLLSVLRDVKFDFQPCAKMVT
jgi:hypothetical protein